MKIVLNDTKRNVKGITQKQAKNLYSTIATAIQLEGHPEQQAFIQKQAYNQIYDLYKEAYRKGYEQGQKDHKNGKSSA